ncbi:MAG: helix-turn-helix domain-containing protein [Clostridiales Family XIII bacterium]|nr:helix-turn-helix domain-containing protein [Clostridiales Family XIII bacterium]
MHISKSVLGSVVKSARKRHHLTQEALAERVNVGTRYLMAIENEGKTPGFDVLYHLIRELNIAPDDIFYPDRRKPDDDLDYLVRLLSQCSEKEVKAITALAESLVTPAYED